MKWETVVVIVITAVVSLLAGQVGAWFQYRRDRDAQERRNEQENERQDKDLASRERQADDERTLQDTLDWRSRRLDAYSKVSTQLGLAMQRADEYFAYHRLPSQVEDPGEVHVEAFEALRVTIDDVMLLSDKPLREIADRMQRTALMLERSCSTAAFTFARYRDSRRRDSQGLPPPEPGSREARDYLSEEEGDAEILERSGWFVTPWNELKTILDEWGDQSRRSLGVLD